MPPLNEGTLLYMPTAVPGMSISEATRILQIQDRQLKKIPEVETVFGKAGQAETPTDPAPLSMFETVVTLKPLDQWRPGMTWEKLIAEMNANIKTPGHGQHLLDADPDAHRDADHRLSQRARRQGLRARPGRIQDVAVQIEKALTDLPDTRSVFAERTTGGYFLDFTVNREAAARYGLTVGDVNDVVETAIGGKTIATTVEGRERYPVSVRYARDFRQDLDVLKRVLVPDADRRAGADRRCWPTSAYQNRAAVDPQRKRPAGRLRLRRPDDERHRRLRAQALPSGSRERVQFPPGYYMQWAGQFEYLKEAEAAAEGRRPVHAAIIFVLIYLNTQSVAKTVIVLLAVPFSLVGAFWLLYLLGYNMSVAVWVGLIALAGLDAETGVVMLLYLDHAWEKYASSGRMNTLADLHAAVKEGAVQRIRPKIMTVCAILFGLLPIMWSPATQAGADVMKRIATPMIGGIVTSAILELLLYPVIFVMWKSRLMPVSTV